MIRCLIGLPKCVAICVTFGRGRAPRVASGSRESKEV
jgi:hypothetical protein